MRELAPEGMVEIHGELWRARSGGEPARLGEGERVRVLTMEGLLLRVAPTDPPAFRRDMDAAATRLRMKASLA